MRSRCVWLLLPVAVRALAADPVLPVTRVVPEPLPGHPGNIFVRGEEVRVPLPGAGSDFWHAFDYDGNVVGEGRVADGRADLGRLPVGYYEIGWFGAGPAGTNRLALAVLAPLDGPTPLTSPIALDVAMAWFYPKAQMPAVANLCALAGVNWVRDRLAWPELEPRRGRFAVATRYDDSARAQAAAGLQVLQVNHLSPPWANPDAQRFPPDLRDVYQGYRALAARWPGEVLAFEPWNEADIPMFGGQTGSQIATFQKAAYLGLKAGNPHLIVCENVFALHRRAILEDFAANRAWPYFDTFNLHHYVAIDEFDKLYADFRAVSAGKPLWVTECSMPVKWSGDPRRQEPSDADLRVQAERVAKVYAAALFEGAREVFYFLLPHYAEGQTQFGILRPDLTPRPAYVALAAAGRLLANARPLGRLRSTNALVCGYMFQLNSPREPCELLIAWSSGPGTTLALPANPQARFDYLGRQESPGGRLLGLDAGPAYVVLPRGSARKLLLTFPPAPARPLRGQPSSVVLQAVWPAERTALDQSAYRLAGTREQSISLKVYNFGDQPVRGKLWVRSPAGVKATFPRRLEVEPGGRKAVTLTVAFDGTDIPRPATLFVTGNFGWAGKPVLSLRLAR